MRIEPESPGRDVILFGLGTLLFGIGAFVVWARHTARWPFAAAGSEPVRA